MRRAGWPGSLFTKPTRPDGCVRGATFAREQSAAVKAALALGCAAIHGMELLHAITTCLRLRSTLVPGLRGDITHGYSGGRPRSR